MKRARGFALMLAIFLIVTLAAIGVYLVTVSTGQVEAATQEEQGARAYQAARTGVEWGAFQLLRNAAGGFATSCTDTAGAGTATQTLTLAQGLAGFYAKVDCLKVGPAAGEAEGAVTVFVYRLTATGCNQSACTFVPGAGATGEGPTYVERQLQLTLTLEQ